MQITASYTNGTYSINGVPVSASELYRVRLFLNYSGILSYVGDSEHPGKGLVVDGISGVLYDDWNCSFRPPRIIDDHRFNCELVVPLRNANNEFSINTSGNVVDGESLLSSETTNPVNMLIEKCSMSDLYSVNLISIDGNNVTVTTSVPHGLKKGDAVTIRNNTYSSIHTLGPDGLRLLGTYKVVAVTATTFTYVSSHYVMPTTTMEIEGDVDWVCEKWTAVVYTDSSVAAQSTDGVTKLTYASLPSYVANDYVNLLNKSIHNQVQVSRVDHIDSSYVVEIDNCEIPVDSEIDVYFSPRTPSAAVPTNWYNNGDGSAMERVSNPSQYDHTMNTYFVSPYLDTYFTKGDGAVHVGEKKLKCAGGDTPSIVCIKFPNITMDVDYGQNATLRMYVSKMSYSEATVSLYQMDSNGWRDDMSYEEVLEHVTQIPVGIAELTNPALKDINSSDNTLVLGSYNSYVDFIIDPAILGQWLSGNTLYSPTVCMVMLSDGNPVIEFNSTESGEQVPYFIVTGGEAALLDIEPFDIVVENSSIESGKVMRIEVDDPDASFGNSLYDNVVKIQNENSVIMNGSPYYIDVLVPDSVAGVSSVQVFKKVRNKEVVLTNPTTIYVNNDLTKRNIRLAAKKNPGEIAGKTSRSAIYNRDLGYSNFKEVTDETSLLQNVYSCLLTSQGERLFNQNFGTHIEERIFTLGSTTDEVDLLKECIEAVKKYEPRVTIDPERSSCEFDDNGCYNLVLAVVLPTSRTEMLKFTFKNRGRIV